MPSDEAGKTLNEAIALTILPEAGQPVTTGALARRVGQRLTVFQIVYLSPNRTNIDECAINSLECAVNTW